MNDRSEMEKNRQTDSFTEESSRGEHIPIYTYKLTKSSSSSDNSGSLSENDEINQNVACIARRNNILRNKVEESSRRNMLAHTITDQNNPNFVRHRIIQTAKDHAKCASAECAQNIRHSEIERTKSVKSNVEKFQSRSVF
ncbi:hypothetical protein RF11_07510 [Thelohanellus kitauei]|uniref:Uncharacterized protein n=1 Tax=Thelohanellus kitauei TaxID=669202 RepID=A0A0C2I8Q7_THEKT|nr:hypothetical protein RF11_07510 [Thelohanellus kitauei]